MYNKTRILFVDFVVLPLNWSSFLKSMLVLFGLSPTKIVRNFFSFSWMYTEFILLFRRCIDYIFFSRKYIEATLFCFNEGISIIFCFFEDMSTVFCLIEGISTLFCFFEGIAILRRGTFHCYLYCYLCFTKTEKE